LKNEFFITLLAVIIAVVAPVKLVILMQNYRVF